MFNIGLHINLKDIILSDIIICYGCNRFVILQKHTHTHLLILPHINYCLLVWGSKSGKILQLQKKKQFERSPVQDTFLIPNHYLNSMIF